MQAALRSLARQGRRTVAGHLPGCPPLEAPVFIVGCGRSGTTILGELLASHRAVSYLAEPREIWAVEPRTDIWSEHAARQGGRLVLDAGDVRPKVRERLTRAFAAEVRIRRGQVLVEKLPINSFRIGFITGLFPDARFVHLIRNGVDVARSIARRRGQGGWLSHGDYKWQLLEDHAMARGQAHRLPAAPADAFERGLLEWVLSVHEARRALARVPKSRWIELRYEGLFVGADAICAQLEDFLGIMPDPAMRTFAAKRLRRPEPDQPSSEREAIARIAGDLLSEFGYAASRAGVDA